MNWRRLYGARIDGEEFQTTPTLMARAVFTASLTGAGPYASGTEVLGTLDLQPAAQVLTDHRLCYPPTDRAFVLEPLAPDRLAEDFIALMIPGHDITGYDPDPWATDALVSLLRGPSSRPAYISRAVTFLAVSATRWPHVAECIEKILLGDPSLAVQAGSAALTAIANVPTIDIRALEAIEARFPSSRRLDLDAGIASISTRLTQHRVAAFKDEPAKRASLHLLHASRLSSAGLYTERFVEHDRAVKIYRELIQTNRQRYSHDLAMALHSLAWDHLLLNHNDRALAAAEESYELFLQAPETSTADIAWASSLNGTVFDRVGRKNEGLQATEKSVAIYRDLVRRDPAFEPELADELDRLGIRLTNLDRNRDALAATSESVSIYRRLADEEPDEYGEDLATALSHLAADLRRLFRYDESHAVRVEVADIRRRLATINPVKFQPALAEALERLSSSLERGDVEAVALAEQAVEIYEQFAEANPEIFNQDLAEALTSLSDRLGLAPEAILLRERALDIYRGLAGADNRVASTVDNLGHLLSEIGVDEALIVALRIVDQHRRKAESALFDVDQKVMDVLYEVAGRLLSVVGEAQPDKWRSMESYVRFADSRPDVSLHVAAAALAGVSLTLSIEERRDDAVSVMTDTVSLYRILAATNPTIFERRLAESLRVLALQLYISDRVTSAADAADAASEACIIYRRLTSIDPSEHRNDLASVLRDFAGYARDLGRDEERVAALSDLVEVRDDIFTDDQEDEVNEALLAYSLDDLSSCLADNGRLEDALATQKRSASIFDRLANRNPTREYLLALAMAYEAIHELLARLDKPVESLDILDEAIAAYRMRARLFGGAEEIQLGNALIEQSTKLFNVGRLKDAAEAVQQAWEILIRLKEFGLKSYQRAQLAKQLLSLYPHLMEFGKAKEATEAAQRGIVLYETLTREDERYGHDFAHALDSLKTDVWRTGSTTDAIAFSETLADLYERLAGMDDAEYTPKLVETLTDLANRLRVVERMDEAAKADNRALEIRRRG
jgi:hypothetical protein